MIPADRWTAGGDGSAVRAVSFDEWVDWLVTTRVTEKSGTFTRFDLAQAVGSALPADTGLATVEATVNRALASPVVVQVGDHWTERRPVHAPDRTVADDRELLYTSRSLLAVERRLLEQLAAGAQTGTGVLEPVAVEAAIEHSTLGDDQAAAIRALTSNGDRISVMVGRAGTGKTHTLGTLRDRLRGRRMVGHRVGAISTGCPRTPGGVGHRVDDDRPAPGRTTNDHHDHRRRR